MTSSRRKFPGKGPSFGYSAILYAHLTKFAELRLIPGQFPEALDRELIKKRRTSRLHYNGAPVSESTLSILMLGPFDDKDNRIKAKYIDSSIG